MRPDPLDNALYSLPPKLKILDRTLAPASLWLCILSIVHIACVCAQSTIHLVRLVSPLYLLSSLYITHVTNYPIASSVPLFHTASNRKLVKIRLPIYLTIAVLPLPMSAWASWVKLNVTLSVWLSIAISIYIFYSCEIGFILEFGCTSVCHSLHRPSYTFSQLHPKFEG